MPCPRRCARPAAEHEALARVHDARARLRLARAEGDEAGERPSATWRGSPSEPSPPRRTWPPPSTAPGRPGSAAEEQSDAQRATVAERRALDREIDAIGRALDEHGRVDRSELARLVGARYWGPGRFAAALHAALDEGRSRQVGRGSFAPPTGP